MKFAALCTLAISLVSTVVAKTTTDDRFPGHVLSSETTDPGSLGIDTVKQLAGYLDIEDQDKHFFYWFFESRNDPANDPVILWLSGGPGCSSMTGVLFENGPSSIDDNLKPVKNPYSWNNKASVIYLDQPVGTGFSYSNSEVSDSVLAADDVYAFLELFFKANPQFSKLPFHVFGESYGGHYAPAVGSEILTHPDRSFNFASIAIGNGLTDPLTQYNWYEPMACGQGGQAPVLSSDTCSKMLQAQNQCIPTIQTCYDSQNDDDCYGSTYVCNDVLGYYASTGLNVYDERHKCESTSSTCYPGIDNLVSYLNQPQVQQALGVDGITFSACASSGPNSVYNEFVGSGDWTKPYQENVTTILEQGIPVLAYYGDKDFICNWLGGHAWTDALPWSGHSSFSQSSFKEWSVNGNSSGQVKNYEHLTFLRVYQAGHMVPYDQPESALGMVNSWISGNLGLQ